MIRGVSQTLALLLLLFFVYGLIFSRYDLGVLPLELEPKNATGFYDYKGVINVHSNLSSGSGSVAEIVAAGQETNLDFIVLTDLNNFTPTKDHEGYHQNLMLFSDGEYSYLDARLLNIDASTDEHLQGPGRSQALFTNLLSQTNRDPKTGIFILTHPFKPGFQWSGEYPVGLDGIEILNLRSIWEKAWHYRRGSFLWTLAMYSFNPELAFIRLFAFPEDELKLWDELNSKQKRIGVAGTDAEAKLKVFGDQFVQFPAYETLFKIVRNHVLLNSELTGNFADDRKKIMQALRNGQFYFSFDLLANPKGFSAIIKNSKGAVFPMGSQIPWSQGLSLEVQLPQRPHVNFEVVVYKNGTPIERGPHERMVVELKEAGVYRIMVRVIPTFPIPEGKHWIPWIFSNPFFVEARKI